MNASMIKSVIGLASGFGASYVVGNVIKATTPENLTKLGKVGVWIGGFAIGGIVAKSASDYTEWQFDQISTMFKS